MRARINTIIEFDFHCENEEIDPQFLKDTKEEYANMLVEEMENYLREEIEDEELKILNVKSEIEYIEDLPKKENK